MNSICLDSQTSRRAVQVNTSRLCSRFIHLFSHSRASASTEVSAKEQEAPSSKAEQLEEPQAKLSDAVLEERIVQAVIDKLRLYKEPQIIINFFGGNHIVAPNAREAYQQFLSSSQPKKD